MTLILHRNGDTPTVTLIVSLAESYYSDQTLLQSFQPMAAQLSKKLRSHWLKFLRQRHVAVVRQGPGHLCVCLHYYIIYIMLRIVKMVSIRTQSNIEHLELDMTADMPYLVLASIEVMGCLWWFEFCNDRIE